MSRWRRSRQEPQEPETPPIVSEFASLRPPVSAPARPTTLIGRNLEVKGAIKATTDLTVEGSVEGRVDVPGQTLTIGVTARATANVRARIVIVRGMVVGNIEAAERVEVLPTGTVCGDVTAERLILAEGSSFNGSVNLGAGAHPLSDAETMMQPDRLEDHADTEMPAAKSDTGFGRLGMWTLTESGEA